MTIYEAQVACRTYSLFKGFETLIGYYFGKPIELNKISDGEIRQLKRYLEDPINDKLDRILNFRFEDESSVDDNLDMSLNLLIH